MEVEHGHVHLEVLKLGETQYSTVARRQFLEIGFSSRQVDHWLVRGTLCPVFPGAYSVGRRPESWRSMWMAALLAAGPGSTLTGMAAASLWGITDRSSTQVEVHRPKGRTREVSTSKRSGWALTARFLTRKVPKEIEVVRQGIRTLTVPEVLLDLAATVTEPELEAFVSGASQNGHLDENSAARIVRYGRGREGIAKLRRQLRHWDPEMKNVLSFLETMCLRLGIDNGMEVPKTNHHVCGLMVDFVWLGRKVVVEVDGFAFHGDRVSFERDHKRQATLMQAGFLRLSFTYRQVADDPDGVVRAVERALETWAR